MRSSALTVITLSALALACTYVGASAAAAPVPSPSQIKNLGPIQKNFVSACTEAFDRSSGNGSQAIGQKICECTVIESKSQGATPATLKRETAKIKADPKHKISDPKLLAAFQYCAIELLRDD
jgi:hypothetical protein